MRKVAKGNVTIKLWDLGGQPRFRSMWERYCRSVSAIVYVLSCFIYNNFAKENIGFLYMWFVNSLLFFNKSLII